MMLKTKRGGGWGGGGTISFKAMKRPFSSELRVREAGFKWPSSLRGGAVIGVRLSDYWIS